MSNGIDYVPGPAAGRAKRPVAPVTARAIGVRTLLPDLLKGLTEAERMAFYAECTPRICRTATEILRQDEPAPSGFLIIEGRIQITFVDCDGNLVIAHVACPGEVVGEIELLSGKTCAATCTTLPNTTLLVFSAALLTKHVPTEMLLRNFAGILHSRLMRDNRLQSIAQFYPAEARICLHLMNLTNEDQPEALISQGQLAILSGCSRQTVNRTLNDLRAQGIIEMGRGVIRVIDATRLEASRLLD
ncbi:Crp/Fnr family transcriptional regulator [Paracoccus laeviglucosivorans]|uniref:cAMP-binding domain of CRP or a regulatory subunit of cAMP-dependent protein kinases n=1 Tax=Paracoccus laeviglucosivorans TaxID=1197861 RepID=A0A521ACZ0_9RHOB|nr:Crp/Fnr family transcriptional regulator [Paracoccus laeviglucosivorans]SMO32694.1 cAMP-binding domain of CRP or a regulatory subunit of cAMP-dependent protein kinases [Paracoccus laeviglucosivorans]